MTKFEYENGKKIINYELEYAVLPREFRIKTKKGKREIDVSDSDDDILNDDSKTKSNDSDDEKKDHKKGYLITTLKIGDEIPMNDDELIWNKIHKTFKGKKKEKYELTNLKIYTPYGIRIRAKNNSGWGSWISIFGQTKRPSINTKLINAKEMEILLKWIPKDKKKYKWKLLYSAAKDGATANIFHQKCDNKGVTVTLIKVTNGNICGGYTNIPWSTQSGYKNDSTAFLFLLRSNNKIKPSKWSVSNANNAVYHNSGYGPTFGSGHDLYLCNNCITSNGSYTNLGTAYYNTNSNRYLLTGSYNFKVQDYQVFLLYK